MACGKSRCLVGLGLWQEQYASLGCCLTCVGEAVLRGF